MVAADGRASPWLDVDAILADPEVRIVVCCGAGGVGKTTTAAALGLRAAEQHGRRTVVLTIDPARRLAQALGLTELDNTPRQVKGTNGAAGGELHAMMLDMKRTFDDVVLAHTDPKRAEEIFANPFYQAMSTTFAGTQEYMAMEKLGQLHARDEWDLIVVDTPPSRSALDFLDAPARLGRFLDGRMLRLLLAPARPPPRPWTGGRRTCCASTPRWLRRSPARPRSRPASPRNIPEFRWYPSPRSPPTSMTSTGCARSAPRYQLVSFRAAAAEPPTQRGLAGRADADQVGVPVADQGRLEHLAPTRYLRVPAQERAALPFGHAAPHPELDVVVQCVRQALVPHRAASADPLRDVLLSALDEECVRIAVAACRHAGPVSNHPHRCTSPLVVLPPGPPDPPRYGARSSLPKILYPCSGSSCSVVTRLRNVVEKIL